MTSKEFWRGIYTKKDKQEAFLEWCKKSSFAPSGKPYEYTAPGCKDLRPHTLVLAGFGDYEGSDRQHRLYASWRCIKCGLSVQENRRWNNTMRRWEEPETLVIVP